MCRLMGYVGPELTLASLLTEPEHSLIRQSTHSRERSEPLNGDGFGLVWYRPELSSAPGRLRSVSPAWSNQNLREMAPVTKSGCVLGHIRAASPGLPVVQTNCHPFISGRYSLMHNGNIEGFCQLRQEFVRRLSNETYCQIQGTTDSEHVFGLFLDAMKDIPREASGACLALGLEKAIVLVAQIVSESAAKPQGPIDLNLVVTDGSAMAATRFTTRTPSEAGSLYVHEGSRYVCVDGICHMVDPDTEDAAIIIASEPVSADPGWDMVPPNHVLHFGPLSSVSMRPIVSAF